ncbi:hypothetical protein BLNAU_14532 [Blattamonas nauphoetae]|uniref:Uncharacterized protein n=1 Tax=Blattamonas nauphoetae TaxID=2049346 RepID=A0ABQ9XGU7_9EUKA|nr:hypothetical protein BLNAU_14532 [Blattamonas nauphoetae]
MFLNTLTEHICPFPQPHLNTRFYSKDRLSRLIGTSSVFVSSLSKLIILAGASPLIDVHSASDNLVVRLLLNDIDHLIFLMECGLITTLVDTSRHLNFIHSENEARYHSFIVSIVGRLMHSIPTQIRNTQKRISVPQPLNNLRNLLIASVLVPARPSLVYQARTTCGELLHLRHLSTPSTHPETTTFFEGVWDEVRKEAIDLVCGDDSSVPPEFLTMRLFQALPTKEASSALTSLSSYLRTTPSPPQPVLSSIHLLLSTFSNKPHYMFDPISVKMIDCGHPFWIVPDQQFFRCLTNVLPSLLMSANQIIIDDTMRVLQRFISDTNHIDRPDLAEADLFVNLTVPLDKLRSQCRSTDDKTLDQPIIVIRSKILGFLHSFMTYEQPVLGPTGFNKIKQSSLKVDQLREKILIPCQPFIASEMRVFPSDTDEIWNKLVVNVVWALLLAESTVPELSTYLESNGVYLALIRQSEREQSTPDLAKLVSSVEYNLTRNTNRSMRLSMKGRNEQGYADIVEQLLVLSEEIASDGDAEYSFDCLLQFLGVNKWRKDHQSDDDESTDSD